MDPRPQATAPGAVLRALRLGLRDTLTLRALASLAGLWLASALLWLLVFLAFRAEIWHAMKMLASHGAGLGLFGVIAGSRLGSAGPVAVTSGAAGAMAGGVLALLAMVPLVGLLLPWMTGSAVCHLALRAQAASKDRVARTR